MTAIFQADTGQFRMVSINLNRRLCNQRAQALFSRWIASTGSSIVIAQEPVKPGKCLPTQINGLSLICGDDRVACWSQPGVELLAASNIPAVLVKLGQFVICGTYLSGHSSRERVHQLGQLRKLLTGQPASIILAGDFNLAPWPSDGQYGEKTSHWTRLGERDALIRLTNELELLDLTSRFRIGAQHFTFERLNKQQWTRFRCDLAFGTIGENINASYDHSVRLGSYAFTDHSACVIDFRARSFGEPIASRPAKTASDETVVVKNQPHKTAIKRAGPSRPLKAIVSADLLSVWGVSSVLDYGCGYGSDVQYLNEQAKLIKGFHASGYDPHPPFGFCDLDAGKFDLVLMIYVLNVLSSVEDRLETICRARAKLQAGGRLFIAVRSTAEIERLAKRGGWLRQGDGFWSNYARGMFQCGLSQAELERLVRLAGFQVAGARGLKVPGSVVVVAQVGQN